ncbi:MAG: cytochrome c [Bacteroidales bacterium]|nr:cytochrome c [Bacteroidales bacterium]
MKKFPFYLLSLIAILSLSLISCGNGAESNEEDKDSAKVEETLPNETTVDIDLTAGKKVYVDNCMVCHQENGEGVVGTFPPLANSDYLLADKMRAVKQAIYGSKTPITVNGVEYPGNVMTVINLTDEQVRDVVNYILNSWGNNDGTVTIEDVKAAREK